MFGLLDGDSFAFGPLVGESMPKEKVPSLLLFMSGKNIFSENIVQVLSACKLGDFFVLVAFVQK